MLITLRRRRQLVAVTAAACSLALAACGSSSSSSSSSAAGTTGSATAAGTSSTSAASAGASSSGGIVAAAQKALAQGYKGTYRTPASGPPAKKGQTIDVVESGFADYGDQIAGDGIEAAAKAIGWKVQLLNGDETPSGETAAIDQAVSEHPDGIITEAIDCSNATAAYAKAKAAKIPVIGFYEFDCNDPSVGGQQDMTSQIDAGAGGSTAATAKFFYNWGKLHADYLIAKTHGKAKVIEFATIGFLDVKYEDEGFDAEMKKCSGCQIVDTQDITAADLVGGGAATKIGSAILAHQSEANSMYFDNDSILTDAASVLRSHPHPSWIVLGGEGTPESFGLIRSGNETALFDIDDTFLGYCSVYNMNEVLQSKPVTDCGVGYEIVDKGHNLPTSDSGFKPSLNFESVFLKQWQK